ncbi:uncharacterized protein LOC113371584 isoform X2 [Ctenocephalides felis]|uniref:uncharacterized protein LOC113371584 isoform X2 n=1 Tax=Ctenocephalides felis TaxID=7515 RepID=UPI000E6E3499|nr:uncharacterized protein LOC113371584 isoform X2 [Ctenocephalides felis]
MPLENNLEDTVGIVDISSSVSTSKQINLEENENENNFHDKSVEADKVDINKQNANDKCHTPIPTSINLECDNNDQCKLSLSGKSEVVSQDNPLLKLPKECQTLENKDSDIFDETSKINQNSDSEIVKPIANADDFSRSDTKHKDYCDNSQTKSFIVKPRNETKDNIENILDNLHKPYDSLENTVTVKDTDTLYNAENKDSISLDGATIQNKMFLDNNEVSPQLADSKENTLVDHSTITNDDNLRHLNKIHSEVQHEENSKSITISCNFDSSKNITTTDKVDVKDEVLNSETFVKNSVHSCPQSVVGENSIISNNNDTTLENQEISEQARKDCGENLKLCLVSEEVSDQKKMIKNETSQDFNKTEEYVVNVNTESKLVSTENIIETDPNNFEKNISGLTELHEKEAKLAVKSDKAKKEKLLEDSTDDNLILNNTCEAKIFICESVTDIEKPSKIHEKEDLLNKDADTHQSSNNIIEVQSINKTVDTSESADVFELKTSMVDKDSVHEIPKNENVEIKEGSLGIEQRDSQEHEKVDAHLNVEHVSIVRASDKDELLQTKIEVVEESNIASNKSSQLNDIENRKQNDDIPLISELVVPCTNTVPHSLENDQVSNEDNFMVNDIIISNSCLIKSKNKNDQIEIGKEIEKDAESDSKLVTHGEEKLITSTAIDINKTEVTSHENVIEKNCDKSDIISTTTDNDNEKLELKVISEKQSEQKLEKEIEILDDKEATKFDIKEMKGEKVLDTNILSIKEQENQSTIGDQNQLDISKNKDLLKEELLEYNTPAEETHTGGKKSIDDVNELDLSVKIVGPSMESEEKCLKSEMTEVSVKLDDANMQESSAPRSTDACIFDESNKTMDESMQKQDDKNFKTDVHNKKELKTVNLSLTQESIKENVDKKEEMEEENKDNTEVVQDLKCKLKDQNSDLSKLDTKLESQKNATMKIALKSSECQENSINIAKNILSIDNFDIESSPLKCTIVDSTISEIIDYSKGKVDDITTPLAAKHTNPDTKNTLINKDDSNSEHAAHEYEKLDSDTEFPEASISDEEIVQEDPLADPLAGTIDVVDDTSKADEENQQASLTGSIRVRNIKDLKIESAAKPNTRKRRISDKVEDSVESVGNISSDEECGGKRLKMRGRRSNVAKRKVAVHNKSKPQKEASSSDEEEEIDAKAKPNEKTKTTEDNSKGKKNKVKKHDESEKKGNKTGINKNIEPDRKRTKTRRIMGLVVDEDAIISKHDESNVRQSRRIAQIKIKEEAERRKVEEITLTHLKQESQKKRKSKNDDKEFKVEKRKRKQQEESSSESEPESHSCDVRQDKKKKRGRRRKQTSKPAFDETKPWQSSSESSSEKDGEEDDIEFEHYHSEDDNIPVIKSDHEFSPESDLEGGESQPTRRARTAKKESEEAEICDDQRCQKCGKSDQPEWILLCDECDHGYHCSCLKPVLFIIPEGDWYCPPCQQKRLIINLQMQLVEFDKLMKRKEEEDLRKERLAIAGVNEENSMDNEGNPKHSKEDESESSSSETSSSGSTDSEEDESGYKLRERRAANVCYRFNDYDDLINKAIKDEMDVAKESAGNMGRGKDISTIIEAENEKKADNEVKEESIQKDEEKQIIEKEAKTIESGSEYDEKSECKDKTQSDDSSSNSDSERLNQLQVLSKRKKQRKLNALDVSSEEDHVSDEDFKGSSADSEDEDLESNSDFSDSELDLPRKKGATRRSTRARMTRFDKAFINDSDDSSDAPKRKKKYKSILSDEDEESMSSSSEDSTTGWKSGHKRGYKKSKAPVRKMPKFPTVNKSESAPAVNKKPKKKRTSEISDLSFRSGGLKKSNDLDEPMEGRRTRGRKINYVEALASDSDEDKKKKKKTTVKKIVSEDEYVPVEEDNVATNPNTKEFDIEGQDKIDTAFIKNENIPKSDLLINALTKTPQTVAQVDRHVAALDERENLKKDADILNSITMADSSHGKPSTLTLSKLHEKVTSNKNFNTHIGGKTPLVVRNPNLLDDRSSLPKVARVDTSFEESGDCIDEEEEESIDEEEEEFDEEDIHEENEYMDSNKSKIEESEDVIAQRMMEDPDFAAMRLQQVGVQIAKDKKKKAAEEKKMLKEQRKLERIRKRDEKAKIKEERAKEREEKKLAKQAALAALAASPVERKKPGRKPKALTVASQNQQISDSGELHLSVSEKQVNAPSSSILSNRLNPNIPIQSQAAGTGFNLGSISVTPIKTLSAVQNQPATSDNVKVLSPMMSNPSSPCTSSSMSNTSTPGVVSGTSPVPNPQNFSLANLRPQNMNVPHAGQHLMTSQSTNVRHPLTPQTNAGFMGMGMPGLQNIPTTPKRRGRGRGKKAAAAAEAAANQLVGRSGNKHDEKGVTNLSIAAPPQPFSASQPSPSVITRMLHNPGGNPPVSINPTAPVTCDSNMPTGSVGLTTSPSSFQGKYYPHSENYLQRPRGPMGAAMGIYRPAGPMGNYPPRGMYHSPHHPLDPSPSGGGPINVQPNILPTSAPGQIGAPPPLRPGTPPKARMPYEYMHPASGPRHSQFSQNPPYGYQGQPSQAYMQPAYQYEPGSQPPPSLHQPPHSVAQPVHVIPGSVIDDQQYNNPDSEPARSSSFEPEGEQDEESGEFGGLVSYFSSQREDDLET